MISQQLYQIPTCFDRLTFHSYQQIQQLQMWGTSMSIGTAKKNVSGHTIEIQGNWLLSLFLRQNNYEHEWMELP